jgi:hypothetical protein
VDEDELIEPVSEKSVSPLRGIVQVSGVRFDDFNAEILGETSDAITLAQNNDVSWRTVQ